MGEVRKVLDKELFRAERLTQCVMNHVTLKEKGWSLMIFGSAGSGKSFCAKTIAKALNRKLCTVHLKDLTREKVYGGPKEKTSLLAKCMIKTKCMNPVIYFKNHQDLEDAKKETVFELEKLIESRKIT